MENNNRANLIRSLKALEPIHFAGALGSGMFPLASICQKLGVSVTGEDLVTTEQSISFPVVQDRSIDAANLIANAGSLVVSSAVNQETLKSLEKNLSDEIFKVIF